MPRLHDVGMGKPQEAVRKSQTHTPRMAAPGAIIAFRREKIRHFRCRPRSNRRHSLAMQSIVAVEHRGNDVTEGIGDQAIGEQIFPAAIPNVVEAAMSDLVHAEQIDRDDMKIWMVTDNPGEARSCARGHVKIDY